MLPGFLRGSPSFSDCFYLSLLHLYFWLLLMWKGSSTDIFVYSSSPLRACCINCFYSYLDIQFTSFFLILTHSIFNSPRTSFLLLSNPDATRLTSGVIQIPEVFIERNYYHCEFLLLNESYLLQCLVSFPSFPFSFPSWDIPGFFVLRTAVHLAGFLASLSRSIRSAISPENAGSLQIILPCVIDIPEELVGVYISYPAWKRRGSGRYLCRTILKSVPSLLPFIFQYSGCIYWSSSSMVNYSRLVMFSFGFQQAVERGLQREDIFFQRVRLPFLFNFRLCQ